jgi:hypothetical protein
MAVFGDNKLPNQSHVPCFTPTRSAGRESFRPSTLTSTASYRDIRSNKYLLSSCKRLLFCHGSIYTSPILGYPSGCWCRSLRSWCDLERD